MSNATSKLDVDQVKLVPLEPGYRFHEFDCKYDEYASYLTEQAVDHQARGISYTYLLISKTNADILGYISVCMGSFNCEKADKNKMGIGDIPFRSIPALKIGKLAVNKHYERQGWGKVLLELAKGIAMDFNRSGVACRLITVDADIEHDIDTPNFYIQFGFSKSTKVHSNSKSVPMWYCPWKPSSEELHTGTEN